MANVKLFGQTYSLPSIANERFCILQRQVNEQSRLIQEGVRHRPRWLRIVRFPSVPLSSEERFQQLNLLIKNYDAIIDELRNSKDAYQLFFAQLTAEVRQALDGKREEMRSIEQERLASYQEAIAQQDEILKQLALEDEERLLQGVRLLGQAALLLLKKIAVCQDGITRLAEDQELQRQVLTQLIGRLERHRQAYERRRRIDRVVREVAEMAKVALQFEEYMRRHLGPLQDLLDQVVQVDEALHGAVTEIEAITQRMLQQGTIFLPDGIAPELTTFDEQVLDFLIAGQLKKERLSEVWERLERQEGSEEAAIVADITLVAGRSTVNPVLDALDNIQMLLEMRLPPPLSGEEAVRQTRRPPPQHPLVNRQLHERSRRNHLWRVMVTTASQFGPKFFGSPRKLGLELVLIQAGTFQMGSTVFNDEQPIHEVRISQPFYLGKYPVTQGQWEAVMGNNPSHFRGNPNRPVENVSWEGVQEFIRQLNAREGRMEYRLPTETEWEYAACADTMTDYCFGNDRSQLMKYAWYKANSGATTHAVGQLKPNVWGLYDMHGNVWEWIQDWYSQEYYEHSPHDDPPGPSAGSYRVVRGGGWDCGAGDCRSASRAVEEPGSRTNAIGFRLLRKVP
jgi:formylglycine-generating enzyme required for sulfatase activity